jgi:hypothetical protein
VCDVLQAVRQGRGAVCKEEIQ